MNPIPSLPPTIAGRIRRNPGRGHVTLLAFTVVVFLLPLPCAAADRPNIVLMLADDQGWDGLSVAMAPDVAGSASRVFRTPRLERLALEGMRFSDAYAPGPVCSPSRISIQCGRTPAALHWTKAAPPETGHRLVEPRLVKAISPALVTIGELLRDAGYATAHYGKWHIGGGGPGRHGYDEHDGDTGNEQAFKFADPNPVDLFGMAERAERFMARARDAGKPFFVQLSWNALHAAELARAATKAKYAGLAAGGNGKRADVAAITEDLDDAVGRVLDALDRLGLADTTIVIYTSDNGSGGGKGKGNALSGGKGSLWEGGIRVPLIVRGPGIAAGAVCRVPVGGWDFLPTCAEWAGVPRDRLPRDLEGGSLVPLLAAGGEGRVERAREELLFHFPHYQSGHTPHSAIRLGNLKLLRFDEDGSQKLFDLAADPGERDDLAARRPADTATLSRLLAERLAAVDAQFAVADPEFREGMGEGAPRGGKGSKRPKNAPGRKP